MLNDAYSDTISGKVWGNSMHNGLLFLVMQRKTQESDSVIATVLGMQLTDSSVTRYLTYYIG